MTIEPLLKFNSALGYSNTTPGLAALVSSRMRKKGRFSLDEYVE